MISRLTTAGKWLAGGLLGAALVLASSCIAGHCRGWKAERRHSPPPREDAGELVPEIAAAPVAPACLEVGVPELSREQLAAAAARVGLVLAAPGRAGDRGERRAPAAAPAPTQPAVDDGSAPAPVVVGSQPEPGYPLLLTGETFTSPDTGQSLEVQAWSLCRGCRIDLRGVWGPAPPAAEEPWLANVARAEWELGAALLAAAVDGELVAEPGALAAWRFRSWKTGRATWNARAYGAAGRRIQQGAVALTASWP